MNIFFGNFPDDNDTEISVGWTPEKIEIILYHFSKEEWDKMKKVFYDHLLVEEKWSRGNLHITSNLADFIKCQQPITIYPFYSQR